MLNKLFNIICIINLNLFNPLFSQEFNRLNYDCTTDTCVINRMIDEYRSIVHQNIDSSFNFMHHALSLSRKHDYHYGEINSLRLLADAYSLKFEYEQANAYLDSAENLAKKDNNLKAKVDILNLRGNISSDKGNYQEAIEYYKNVLSISKKINYLKGIYKGYANTGVSYHLSGNYTNAITYYSKAIPIMEQRNDSIGLSIITSNLSGLYQQIGQFKMANEYCLKALTYMDENDKWGYASVYVNMGKNSKHLDNLDNALTFYEKALSLGEEINDKQIILNCYNNIGDIYINSKKENFKKGIVYFNMALKIAEDYQLMHDVAHMNYVLGLAYLKNGFHRQSIEYAEMSLKIAKQNDQKETMSFALETLAGCYYALKKYKLSADYYIEYNLIKDSLNSDDFLVKLSEMEAKYEVDKLEEEKLLSREKEEKEKIAREKIENERDLLIIAGCLMMMMIILIVYFLSQYRKKNKLISAQKDKVELQKNIIQIKNKDLTDSIKYAERIQKAILPNDKELDEMFNESFVFYRPKDIVAGDFYWMESIDGFKFIAVADCTGHGVPGALVSVLCHNALNRSVKEYGLSDPGMILDKARSIIIEELSKNTQEDVKDGMDIALCVIEGNKLRFSGANNPLWYVRNEEIHVVKGNKQPVGKYEVMNDFISQEIDIQKDDVFYLFSDGYVDQFGGEMNKKFKASRLKKLFLSLYKTPMIKQKTIVEKQFNSWKGVYEQMDDVCVVGFRL